jgi:hypothetical protein
MVAVPHLSQTDIKHEPSDLDSLARGSWANISACEVAARSWGQCDFDQLNRDLNEFPNIERWDQAFVSRVCVWLVEDLIINCICIWERWEQKSSGSRAAECNIKRWKSLVISLNLW